MNEQISKYIDPIASFWKKQSKKHKMIFFISLGAVVILAFILVLVLNNNPYITLYSGMEEKEVIDVMKKLDEKGVPYKSEQKGTISIPKEQEQVVRMQLSIEGHPKTALNYDYFSNNIDMMTTEFEKRTYKVYQLNQTIKGCIETLEPIKRAEVNISLPDDDGYVWDNNKKEATASVVLEVNSGQSLSPGQVNGIKQLVAKSVTGLKNENVAVIDANGDELSDDKEKTQIDMANFKLEIERSFENSIRGKVLNILKPEFGNGAVVEVKSVLNLDKKIEEIITYKPSNPDGSGIVSESDKNQEGATNGQKPGGVPGSESNSDVPTYPGITVDKDTIYFKNEESYKYLVNQVKEQIEHDATEIAKLTVGVLVDQKEMSVADKESLQKLVANVAAVDPEQVFIRNSEFSVKNPITKPGTDGFNAWFSSLSMPQKILFFLVPVIIVALILTLIFVMVANNRKKRKLLELEEAAMAVAQGVNGEELIPFDIKKEFANISESKESVLRKEITDFTQRNPEIAAQLIRSWLRGDEGNE